MKHLLWLLIMFSFTGTVTGAAAQSGIGDDSWAQSQFDATVAVQRAFPASAISMMMLWSDDDGHPSKLLGGDFALHRMMGLGNVGEPNEYITVDSGPHKDGSCTHVVTQVRSYEQVERQARIAGSGSYIEMYRVRLLCFDATSSVESEYQLFNANSGGKAIPGSGMGLLAKYRRGSPEYDAAVANIVLGRIQKIRVANEEASRREAEAQAARVETESHLPTKPERVSGPAPELPPQCKANDFTGSAIVQYTVAVDGTATDIQILDTRFAGKEFDRDGSVDSAVRQRVLSSLQEARFRPSTVDGVAKPFSVTETMHLFAPTPEKGETRQVENGQRSPLNHGPELLSNCSPIHPDGTSHGVVSASSIVGKDGFAQKISIISSPSKKLAKATTETIKTCRWAAGVNNSQPVAVGVTQDFSF